MQLWLIMTYVGHVLAVIFLSFEVVDRIHGEFNEWEQVF